MDHPFDQHSMTDFIHLNLHTEFSIVDSLVRIDDLITRTKKNGGWAVALTDRTNLFAAVKFYQATTAIGIKPIIGCEIAIHNPQREQTPFFMTLLCQNLAGYKNLTRLLSKAYVEGQIKGDPQIHHEWFLGATEGLIALSGGTEGEIGQALLGAHPERAHELTQSMKTLFPERFYFEIHRVGFPHEEDYIDRILELSIAECIPLVATNKVRFFHPTDFQAHEVRVCIQEGRTLSDPTRSKRYTEQQYFRTPQEMQKLFSDLPEAIENTVEIAKRCNFEWSLGQVFLPNYPIPKGLSAEEYLKAEAQRGLNTHLEVSSQLSNESSPEIHDKKLYEERLNTELGVINKMGFAGYFLIVADFIRWAREHDVPVGPGRGSGAGSLVAYVLGITDLDPLRYDLLFERFLNPERVSMPDFDVDFCMEGRDRVIEYVSQTYGHESVAQIITYGTMAAKAVIRDVGRVFAQPYGFVDKIAKLIPFELGMTLKKALDEAGELKQRYETEEDVRDLIDMGLQLEGIVRNAGKHAGGVVIAPSVLTDFVPLYCEEGEQQWVTQFDKDDVETIGLVKFDFLGLRTLTIIEWAVKRVNEKLQKEGRPLIDIRKLPIDDQKTYDLLKSCATTAVFQLESRGMKDLIKRLKPDNFEEIIALVALFRPGPLQSGMVDDFIDRKHGRANVDYFHPALTAILKPTYGVILYQEQVMQIAQVLAGYTLGAADSLRRAMGKKKPEEMAKQRSYFIAGALERHVSAELATRIFDLMEKFAGYGFNKSHSAAYALLAYQTAWLKAHYPADFMAAVLSADLDNTDKIVVFIDECRQMGLNVLPPNVNESECKFLARNEREIRYGLGAIKGAGESAIDVVIDNRREHGPFLNLFDFCSRLDLRKVNRRVLEAFIQSGALDCFQVNRATLLATQDYAVHVAEQRAHTALTQQHDLFGDELKPEQLDYVQKPDDSKEKILQGEKETLGLYFSGHPIESYQQELKHIVTARIIDLHTQHQKTVTIAGLVIATRTLMTKRGDRMAFVTMDDGSARIEVAIFSDVFETARSLLTKDKIVIIEGEIGLDDFSGNLRMSAKRVFDLTDARCTLGACLRLHFQAETCSLQKIEDIFNVLNLHKNKGLKVHIEYQKNGYIAPMNLGADWQVMLTDELLHELRAHLGDDHVRVVYR